MSIKKLPKPKLKTLSNFDNELVNLWKDKIRDKVVSEVYE